MGGVKSFPEYHDLVITRRTSFGNRKGELPSRINLLILDPLKADHDLLFIDQVPVPSEAWSYDKHDKILRWKGLYGGGQIHISHKGRGGTGVIGKAGNEISVQIGVKTQFICSAALDCGIGYNAESLIWDPSSPEWQKADWIKNRLLLSYISTTSDSLGSSSYTFEFEDKETGAPLWDPKSSECSAKMTLDDKGWHLSFKAFFVPDDKGDNPATGPDSVFPYWLMSLEDLAVSTINGAMSVDGSPPDSKFVGIQGERVAPSSVGYYQVSNDKAPFAVFDGKIHLNGKPVGESCLYGKVLRWRKMDDEHSERLGLPPEGELEFIEDGAIAGNNQLKIERLSASAAMKAIQEHDYYHRDINEMLEAQMKALQDPTPSIYDLLAMTSFSQIKQPDGSLAWGDVVQAAVRQNLSDIMNSFIQPDIWKLLFPGTPQPTLSGDLAVVANSPVSGVPDPAAWYQQLGTAVLTQGMANGSDKNCKNMNGPRAAQWLKQQVANSEVYKEHGQLLFQNRWADHNPRFTDFLQDQYDNAAAYEAVIDEAMQTSIDEIKQSVVADPSSPDLIQKLINDVETDALYAKTCQLYWAFAFYTYVTAPSILANMALEISTSTGSDDGSTMSRWFQTNIAVLTALDPSGYFAQQYNQTINIFLTTNILPSMNDFYNDDGTFSLINEYLKEFVDQNIKNEDQDIANAAAQIQDLLAQEGADAMLQASIDALSAFSEAIQQTMALPYVAQEWVTWFSDAYPKFAKVGNVFGSLLIGGISALSAFNLISAYKDWSQLTDEERSEVILNSIQMGLQVLAAVVKRGVQLYSIFTVDGMSLWQRTAAVSRILMSGEVDQLNQGLLNISDSTAKWLGNIAGVDEMQEEISLLMNIGENDLDRISWTIKVFGKNLDEFIATRVAPIFILAGIGYSIYLISTGETGVELASNIVNIASGALMLCSMVGGWLVDGGIIAADGIMAGIISFAGPLAAIAAFVGVALMLYEMFKKQPDPVEEFVNNYVKPAGFYVSSSCSSIDYVIQYADVDQDSLMMLGFTLSGDSGMLTCNPDGSITLGKGSALPECVWIVTTDGLGMSQIGTIAQSDTKKGPTSLWLSLMKDNTISFQPRMEPTGSKPGKEEAVVVTQTWLSSPRSDAATTSNGMLLSLDIAFQPVIPDSDGNYQPSQALGWMTLTDTGVCYTADKDSPFHLRMSGLAPNFMQMNDLKFILGTTPSKTMTFAPHFGILPSSKVTYSLENVLPVDFLQFDQEKGVITPNGKKVDKEGTTKCTINAANSLGKDSATFSIIVNKPQSLRLSL